MPSRPALAALGIVVLVLAAGAFVAVGPFQPLVHVGDTVVTGDVASVDVDEFGEHGSHFLRYEEGANLAYAFTLRNDGPVGVTVTAVSLPDERERPLLEPTAASVVARGEQLSADVDDDAPFEPFALGPGEQRDVVVHGRFDNCEFYTERAIDGITGHEVRFRVAGIARTVTVSLERPLLVRSPTIRRCPARSMDRGERRRTDP